MGNKARTATQEHSHSQHPTRKNVLDWLKKPIVREIEIDAALIALCSFLLGGLFFSLADAFKDCRMVL
jgi:hypothetical protein